MGNSVRHICLLAAHLHQQCMLSLLFSVTPNITASVVIMRILILALLLPVTVRHFVLTTFAGSLVTPCNVFSLVNTDRKLACL